MRPTLLRMRFISTKGATFAIRAKARSGSSKLPPRAKRHAQAGHGASERDSKTGDRIDIAMTSVATMASRAFARLTLLLMVVLTACKPTVHDYMLESGQAFQPYVTGDVHVAKSALEAEEKVIARYE